MRILIVFLLIFCSCKNYTPSPPPIPEGVYQGFDSSLYVHDIYSPNLFGSCIEVKKINGKLYFYDILLEPAGEHTFRFDYTTVTQFGIGSESVCYPIRKSGKFEFSYNHLMIDYSVGISGGTMSQYKFHGWR